MLSPYTNLQRVWDFHGFIHWILVTENMRKKKKNSLNLDFSTKHGLQNKWEDAPVPPSVWPNNSITQNIGALALLEWGHLPIYLAIHISLAPKIPCVFLPNFATFDIVGKLISQKIKVWEFKEVTIGSWSYLLVAQFSKHCNTLFHGS
jgi:hypothetical protein